MILIFWINYANIERKHSLTRPKKPCRRLFRFMRELEKDDIQFHEHNMNSSVYE